MSWNNPPKKDPKNEPIWWLKKTIPYNKPRCFVPKIWATIPLVAGTVDNQRKPKLAPNINALILLAGRKINKQIEIPLSVYNALRITFFFIFVDKYPLNNDPKILNKPIKDKIAAAVQDSNPLSIT